MGTFSTDTIFIFGLFVFIILSIFIFILVNKNDRIRQLQNSLLKLKKSFNDLDEQAKLIVKTDLELHKTQEELNKRLQWLEAFQKTSRLISTTLDENEIFQRLDRSLMVDLEFEKNLILIYDKNKIFRSSVNLGFPEEDVHYILSNLQKDTNVISSLQEGHSFSSVNAPQHHREKLKQLFGVEHFIISPILTQNGMIGLVFLGNRSNALAVTEGDEELISILSNQIGQSLENARLFEQVFTSSQALESKIQDRTKQLASALEEVKRISKTKSDFISAISHELRTPLTSIKGYAAILMTGKLGEIPPQAKERLQKINLHSDHLVKLVNDMLDIARIESGRVELTMEKCKISDIIESVRDLLFPQMKEKSIHLVTEIDSKIPPMVLDTSQVDRIFINLVSNAAKFTPEQGTIKLSAKLQESNLVKFEVSDTGIGIAEEDMKNLFSEFFRVENKINSSVKGTGLGLVLVKKIVEAHDGKIWVTSIVNQGTTFHFTLPVESSNSNI